MAAAELTFWRQDGSWRRSDGVHIAPPNEVEGRDDGRPVLIDGGVYDPQCGWCWLNAPHTWRAHALKVLPQAEHLDTYDGRIPCRRVGVGSLVFPKGVRGVLVRLLEPYGTTPAGCVMECHPDRIV